MEFNRNFSTEAANETRGMRVRLDELKLAAMRHLDGFRETATFFGEPKDSAMAAHCVSSCGAVFFAAPFVEKAPPVVAETVAVHELMHLVIGAATRVASLEKHADVHRFLHDVILPDWEAGKIEFVADENDYILDKGWDQLYDGSTMPLNVESKKASDAVSTYFDQLKRGWVWIDDGRVATLSRRHDPNKIRGAKRSLEEAYRDEPKETAIRVATGYALLHYLMDSCKCACASRERVDLTTLEEGFANYVATSVTGVSLEQLQQGARQDECKISLARRIATIGPPVDSVIENASTYEGLVEFSRQIGLL